MQIRWLRRLVAGSLAGGLAASAAATAPVASPLSPDQALATFDTEPGLRVSLVAAEPLIDSPCALAFEEAGRLYVAENRGYPVGATNGEPAGRIALLTDTDADGRMDQRSDFTTALTFPNGVLPWRGGLIVTCAPDVLYLKDTDGDGKADVREVVLTGFATNTTTQLRVNAPLLGPDGWVYLASGLSGGSITSPKRPGQRRWRSRATCVSGPIRASSKASMANHSSARASTTLAAALVASIGCRCSTSSWIRATSRAAWSRPRRV
jgi:glucose/arabinose dehydrogenase